MKLWLGRFLSGQPFSENLAVVEYKMLLPKTNTVQKSNITGVVPIVANPFVAKRKVANFFPRDRDPYLFFILSKFQANSILDKK